MLHFRAHSRTPSTLCKGDLTFMVSHARIFVLLHLILTFTTHLWLQSAPLIPQSQHVELQEQAKS